MRTPPLLSRSSNKAAALIIVLAFVVLVTGLALAYFSRTTADRQLAQSSYNDTSADLLARSALDIVVGDFKQEIVNGSTATSINGTTIYVPTSAANVIPVYNPTPSPSPALAILNLIRRSVRSDTIPSPAVASRASAVNSTVDVSANGRSISLAGWNRHYLVPKSNATDGGSDPITAGFTPPYYWAPDWVIVTRAGPTPFASWDATLADPTTSNYAIGRYAYAVYDEGGLLDMNVVAYPTPVATPIELLTDLGRKGAPAWVDPTAVVPTPTPSGTPFTTGLVGFRNYATTQQHDASDLNFPVPAPLANPGYFPQAAFSSFVNYVLGGGILQPHVGTTTDYGTVNPITAADGRTDQRFVTRAELINFLKTLGNTSGGISVNALQYMGTFSREQNKPSLPLTPAWPFTRVVLPRRFYLGNLNLAVYLSPTPTPITTPTPTPTPTPTATPTLTPTIRTALGLQFVSANTPPPATATPTPTWGPCDSQVRWKYVGNQDPLNTTPLLAIPAFPTDLTTLDFFQYINYALFGRTDADSTDIPFSLGIGAALIDLYDADGTSSFSNANALLTGIYYGSGTSPCDLPTVCLVYGVEYSVSGFNLVPRYVSPTCMAPMPTPDSSPTLGGGPPLINSPTRNVGEFGWAYSILNAANNRNTSTQLHYLIDFKDSYNPNSVPNPPLPDPTHNPDPALLDFFTYNSAPVRSGIVSLNTRQAPVLAAILKGAIYEGQGGHVLTNQSPTYQALNAANAIVSETSNLTPPHGPAMSRADIARFASVVTTAPFGVTGTQDKKDTFARAFSETTQTRTWGLLIDLVAQTGHYKPNAQGLADFVVEGEKRYWLHIAIDRFDGTIVGQQLEEVTE